MTMNLPLSSVLPGVGQTVGVDLGLETKAGTYVSSSQVAPLLMQVVQVTLTAAQIKALHSTPITIVPATAGKTNVLLGLMYQLNYGTTQFASGGTVTLQYHTGPVAASTGVANTFFQGAATARAVDTVVPAAAVVNDAIEAVAASANFTTGDSTVTVTAWYAVV